MQTTRQKTRPGRGWLVSGQLGPSNLARAGRKHTHTWSSSGVTCASWLRMLSGTVASSPTGSLACVVGAETESTWGLRPMHGGSAESESS